MGLISRSLAGLGSMFLKASNVATGVSAFLRTETMPWDSLYGRHTQQDYEKLTRRYSSWVYACASKNASSCAQVPLRLYGKKRQRNTKFIVPVKDVDREKKDWLFSQPQLQTKLANAVDVVEIMEHPFLDLLANVNPFMNGFELIEYWILYQELTGNAYTYIVTDSRGTPSELWIVPPQKMKILPDRETFIKAYRYGNHPMKSVVFEPEEIIHMKYPNPNDIYYGTGPLAAAATAADAGVAMNTTEFNLVTNDAIPRSALITEKDLRQDQADRLKDEWNAQYRGPKKAGRLAVLTGGMQVARVSLTPKEMGYLQGRKATREEVAAIFGVPLSKLAVDDIKRAPAAGLHFGNINYQRDTIQPKLRRIDQKLTEKLLPMYDPNLFCCFDNPVGEDKAYRLQERESNIKSGYSSINEERLRDNQEPVEWGETPWLPSNLIQTDADRTSLSPSLGGGAGANSASIASHKYIDPDDLPSERDRLVRIVKRMFRLQAQEVLSNMPKGISGAVKSLEEYWLPDESKWIGWLSEASTPELTKLIAKGVEVGARQLEAGAGGIPSAPEIEAFVQKHAYKFSFEVHAETTDILRTRLAEGLNAGDGMADLRKRVQATFKDMSDYRAELIARTESARAVNAGIEHGWQASGTVEAKEWNGAADMCEFCRAMDEKYGPGTGGIPLGGTFVNQGEGVEGVDGGNLKTNYGPIEYPPIHPNCRCDLVPVIKEIPPEE